MKMNAFKINKIIMHFRRWNIWRQRSVSGRIHKALVLIGLRRDIACDITYLPEEIRLYD